MRLGLHSGIVGQCCSSRNTVSFSAITALHYKNAAEPLFGDILSNVVTAELQKCKVVFCWVPSHVGVNRNEKSDACATQAFTETINQVQISHSDGIKFIPSKVRAKWHYAWNNETNNKLHTVTGTVSEWESSRHEERLT